MKQFSEITVKVNSTYDQLHQSLINQNFKLVEQFKMKDIYMLPTNIDIYKTDNIEILSKCVIIRDFNNIKKEILIKHKIFKQNQIVKESKTSCPITDVDKAIKLFKELGYRELFSINDEVSVYADEKNELMVQKVNDSDLFIEIEDQPFHIPVKYNSIGEMKQVLKIYNIDYDDSNYFVQKALLKLEELKK